MNMIPEQTASYAGPSVPGCAFCEKGTPHSMFEHEVEQKPATLEARITNMPMVDLILAVENGSLLSEVKTVSQAKALLVRLDSLRYSQGFYSRLCRSLETFIATN